MPGMVKSKLGFAPDAEVTPVEIVAPFESCNRMNTESSVSLALIPAFAAFVAPDVAVKLSAEHDRAEWLRPRDAAERFAWPRERRAVDDILSIVGGGDADLLEDVLRVS